MRIYATERLVIRRWSEQDLERLRDLYSRPEVVRHLNSVTETRTLDEGRAVLHRWQSLESDRFGFWAAQRSDGVVAGTVALVPMTASAGRQASGEVEVGWHLHPDSWGHGYATEMARGAIEKGFADGATEIYATVKPANAASAAVCRRLGMESFGLSDAWDDTEYELFRITATGYPNQQPTDPPASHEGRR